MDYRIEYTTPDPRFDLRPVPSVGGQLLPQNVLVKRPAGLDHALLL